MKFTQISIGQPFRYQGETLVKVGPMTACNEGGGNTRLIPRSAVVTAIGATKDLAPGAPTHPDARQIDVALARFEARWRTALAGLDAAAQGQLGQELDRAQQELRIGLGVDAPPAA